MEVVKILTNWRPVHHTVHDDGEDYDCYEVGKKEVDKIIEMPIDHPLNKTGKHFFDIDYLHAGSVRVFNINTVYYKR